MEDNLREALKYLSAPAGSFWNWADGGQVIDWKHGATIVFREELATVLERLAPRGLPPLDPILLLIAATRSHWVDDSALLRQKLSEPKALAGSLNHFGRSALDVLRDMERIRQFSADLIQPVDAKAAIVAIVFERATRAIDPEISKIVCDILWKNERLNLIPSLPLLSGGHAQTTKGLIADLWTLANGLTGITEESLRYRLQTGLDEEPLPAEVEIPVEPATIQSLLRELAQDDEMSGLARIARNLKAVLHLPRSISDSHELPVGGVSDIVNRGTLDRLLLSELANEDLLLATRIALNEALYLRREAPPAQPPQRRYLLMDSGLRMWGLPRVFATAAMLALGATGTEGATLTVYRARQDGVSPIDPSTREGLAVHLGALEPDVHPGAALEKFFQCTMDEEQPGDIVVMTTDTAYSDPEFRNALRERLQLASASGRLSQCFVATVNREGDFQLWLHAARGAKLVTMLKLDLEELLKTRVRPTKGLVDKSIDPNLPAIFRAEKFPFRLPHLPRKVSGLQKEVLWSVPPRDETSPVRLVNGNDGKPVMVTSESLAPACSHYGVINLSRDGRLVYFDEPGRGGIQIADSVPFGFHLWSGMTQDKRMSQALILRPAVPEFVLLTVDVIEHRLVSVQKIASGFLARSGAGAHVESATAHRGVLYIIYQSAVEVFDLQTGRFLHHLNVDWRMKWRGGRFYVHLEMSLNEEWHVVSYDGSKLLFTRIPLDKVGTTGTVLKIFEREGYDGFYGVHSHGLVFCLADQTAWKWSRLPDCEAQVLDVDCDGSRLLVQQISETQPLIGPVRRVLQMKGEVTCDAHRHLNTVAQWDFNRKDLGGTLIHRFSQVIIGTDDQLTFVSKSKNRWCFQASGNVLQLHRFHAGINVRLSASFEPSELSHASCEFAVAMWKDGSRIVLDSRGLLHLQSSDRTIPEATFVLNASNVAVWTSEGRVCALPYFVDTQNAPKITPKEVIETILKPFAQRLR